jgi:excisionase family DNA binding protein
MAESERPWLWQASDPGTYIPYEPAPGSLPRFSKPVIGEEVLGPFEMRLRVTAKVEAVTQPRAVTAALPPALPGDTLIKEKRACQLLEISESTIKRMRKNNEIPFERVGPGKKLVRYRMSVIQSKM